MLEYLTNSDILWLWANTFDGYRPDELQKAYTEVYWQRIVELAKDGASKEAVIRAQGEAWDLARRNAYMERNKQTINYDSTVEFDDWHAG